MRASTASSASNSGSGPAPGPAADASRGAARPAVSRSVRTEGAELAEATRTWGACPPADSSRRATSKPMSPPMLCPKKAGRRGSRGRSASYTPSASSATDPAGSSKSRFSRPGYWTTSISMSGSSAAESAK